MRALGALAFCLLATMGVSDAACLKASEANQVAEGRLLSVRITNEAYRRTEQAYILQLPAPACLEGPDEFDKVEKAPRIHVFSMDEALRKRIGRLVGKRVRVSGGPFGAHTAHHHAPIVMRIGTIEALR